jgi:hypothetical protein
MTTMSRGMYHIVSETTEDHFDETSSLEEALRIALEVVKEGQAGDPVSIEHDGRVIRQFVLTPEGKVEEESIG